jgi:putative ABC transport system ATP-binding protein
LSDAVVCSGVTRSYVTGTGSVAALQSVDLTVGRGEIAALVGPSGSGKSTLIRLLAALDLPDAGSIEVEQHDLVELGTGSLRDFRRTCVTYVAQRAAANLIPHLTVREQLGAAHVTVAQSLEIGHRLDARADQLSGGEQARAALAVALARETPVLLLDEPTAELDRDAAGLVMRALSAAATDGRTVVLATHDPELLRLATTTVNLAPRRNHPVTAKRPTASAPGAAALEVRGVTKRYAGVEVVHDVSLELRAGELGVLLGRSGSGKSTLLMAAGGWLRPDGGSIAVAGEGLVPPWRRVAYVPQRFALLPELSVRENVELPLRLGGEPRNVDDLLAQLELDELADRPPHEISIGQQQRAALARALVLRPAVLLADEPTSHQDAASAELVWTALASAADQGTACLLATHEEAAAPRADRVWRIDDGRLG